ncbi:hypothetical protein KP79_PYT19481 [Mizuhopecten yessoensis]|uniref:Chitin-binding type-4 domain-containing protein n=1 Tax=Mizuhopecten yessoensis TaxID=6573 RepID=A0A210PFT5_MIZYE|nr:hypothetical protein KP79_PYT19481 [Mizuhopecten yessoensis]
MELFCGGFSTMVSNGGKCGTCGDPYNGERENEAGGKYATGFIVRNYEKGQIIDITIDLTTSHMGFFEFKICANNDVTTPLPPDMTCDQCVLQWHYKAGNNWGVDEITGEGCLGCGDQETFINCADVSISGTGGPTSGPPPKQTTTTAEPTTPAQTTAPLSPESTSISSPITTLLPGSSSCLAGYRTRCRVEGVFDECCNTLCHNHACNSAFCTCDCVPDMTCEGICPLRNLLFADEYCYHHCLGGCPELSNSCLCRLS